MPVADYCEPPVLWLASGDFWFERTLLIVGNRLCWFLVLNREQSQAEMVPTYCEPQNSVMCFLCRPEEIRCRLLMIVNSQYPGLLFCYGTTILGVSKWFQITSCWCSRT